MKKVLNFAVICLWVLGTIGGVGYATLWRFVANSSWMRSECSPRIANSQETLRRTSKLNDYETTDW